MSAERLDEFWNNWFHAGLDVLFPQCCAFCQKVCPLTPQFPGICRSCLSRLPLRSAKDFHLKQIESDEWLDLDGHGIYSAAFYQDPLRQALIRFKFSDAPDLAVALASLLIQQIQHANLNFQAIVAVPLHKARLRERGFNQAGLLAGEVAKRLQLPDWSDCLSRVKATDRQSEQMDRFHRLFNLTGAFRLSAELASFAKNRQKSGPGALPVLLIDDILTTGITLTEAAKPLWQAGFTVTGMVVASNHH